MQKLTANLNLMCVWATKWLQLGVFAACTLLIAALWLLMVYESGDATYHFYQTAERLREQTVSVLFFAVLASAAAQEIQNRKNNPA